MSEPVGPPASWGVTTPADWWRVPLSVRQTRHAAIAALLDRQFARSGAPDLLRVQLEEALRQLAATSAASYGVELWLATDDLAGVPLGISLVISVLPEGTGGLSQLADALRADPGGATLDRDTADAGPVIRRIDERATGPLPVGAAGDSTTGVSAPALVADYWYDVPAGDRLLQLTFSSPLVPLKEGLVELFDSVARSLTWSWA
jgi:hypothetical protein